MTRSKRKRPKVSEKAFQSQVVNLARRLGWRVHHSRRVQIAGGGHATPIQGHKGLPDLILAKDGRVVFIELKGDGGSLQAEQREWARALTGVEIERGVPVTNGALSYLLAYPDDFDAIFALLAAPKRVLAL